MTFDVELLGNCDVIVNELSRRLGYGWNQICTNDVSGTSNEITRDEMVTPVPPSDGDSPYHAPPGGGGGDAITKTDGKAASLSAEGSQSTQSPEVTSSSTTGSNSTTESHDSSNNSNNSNANTHTPASTADSNKDSSLEAANNTEIMGSNIKTEAKSESTENVTLESDLETKNDNAAKGRTIRNEASNCMQQSSMQSDVESKPTASEADEKGHVAEGDGDEAEVRDAHERDDAELAMLRSSWRPKLINLASRLPG